MLVKINSAAVQGLEAIAITVEVNVTPGMHFVLVGLPDNAVKESHERIMAAIQNSGYSFPMRQITINMAPADVKKEGSGFDLPMAVGLMATEGGVSEQLLPTTMLVGELSLDGTLQPVRGALPIAIKARAMGFERLIVPIQNIREAAVVNKLKVYGAHNLREVADLLNGGDTLQPTEIDTRKEFYEQQTNFDYDFADVKGQEFVKRALEVAAAGSHNVLKMCA